MKTRSVEVMAALILIFFAFILFMMYQYRQIDVDLGNQRIEKRHEDLVASFDEIDYHIYWIGTVPEHLEGIADHMSVLSVSEVNSNTMPVSQGVNGFTAYNEEGQIIEHVEQRDYASNMMIVINTTEDISEDAWGVVQNCAVVNHVPVLLIGQKSIDAFREYMILVHKEYTEYSTMLFNVSVLATDDPIDAQIVQGGGYAYANALLEFFRTSFNAPVYVYVTPGATETSVQETQTEPWDAAETVTAEEALAN